ncbi:Alpha/beta knot methyltransferase, partial [Phaeosphaeriaceae sp. PMI808]
PDSLPYTTAASEFIYGYSSVVAALKANRRKLYKLYIHSRGTTRDGLLARIRALKLFPITEEVGDEYLRAMDKASSGRPHNGVILESSPLPVLPITELRTASIEDESFSIAVDSQSAEDAVVNGKQDLYSYKAAGWRHPLFLYVDGVLDEGNLGAIARSAYFLGVDAIVTPTRQIAPWSHIAVKASAGAAEAMPLFKVSEPADFLGKSSRAGWKIYASDIVPAAPPSTSPAVQEQSNSRVIYTFANSTKRLPADHSPVAEHPTILMMGAEGTGLRPSLLNMAQYKVGIQHGREADEIGVDSLNVSVAASLLCEKMLQQPIKKPAPRSEDALF